MAIQWHQWALDACEVLLDSDAAEADIRAVGRVHEALRRMDPEARRAFADVMDCARDGMAGAGEEVR